MSWLPSWFSLPKPYDSTRPPSQSSPPPPEPRRLLEEPAPSTVPTLSKEREAEFQRRLEQREKQNSSPISQPVDRNRNKIIFGAGLVFFGFSLLITRRAFVRKRLAAAPKFYSDMPQHHIEQSSKASGAKEALEALNLATLNVLSVAMMATGGALWYMDVNSIEDARKLLRGGMGVDGTGRTEQEAEEDFEEWMATVLARKETKANAAEVAAGRLRPLVNERGQQR